MPVSSDLLERSGDLKAALVDFGNTSRFARHRNTALDRYLAGKVTMENADLANAMDRFLMQYRLPGGRTVLDVFVEEHLDLTQEERALLLGWRDAVEGIFHVDGRDGNALVMTNLIDELTYRTHSNMGPATLQKMKKGSFVVTRLVPIEDEWLLSGISSIYSAARRDDIYRAAAQAALRSPALVFRNPEKLARAWELQREERRSFVEFFGTDLVVLPGAEVDERLRAYMRFRMHDFRDEHGTSAADRSRGVFGTEPAEIAFELPDYLTEAETVDVIYDEIEGMLFWCNVGLVEEAFADPETAIDQRHADAILDYLRDESISPVLFRRLAERSPERASVVFAHVLNRPEFSWDRDGEALLRQYKADYIDKTPLPSVAPLSSTLARAQRAQAARDAAAPTRPRSGQSTRRSTRRPKRRAGR